MSNVTNLRAYKVLKNPMLAICQQLENHQEIVTLLKNNDDVLQKMVTKARERQFQTLFLVRVLFWSNIISWLTIGGLIIVLFCHSHSITSLL